MEALGGQVGGLEASWKHLGGSWRLLEALGGILEALGGILEAADFFCGSRSMAKGYACSIVVHATSSNRQHRFESLTWKF